MTPTLQLFSRALQTPDLSFATLQGAQVETTPCGVPRLVRTTRFVEARIVWQGDRYLLSMPLTPAAMLRIEPIVPALGRLNSAWLTSYRILPHEMCWHNDAGKECRCDLILQHLPEGCDFTEAPLTTPRATLLAALDALNMELQRIGFTHNNLKAENLRWNNGKLIPLRYHDAQLGDAHAADAAACESLRQKIHLSATTTPTATLSDTSASYNPLRTLTGHLWMSNIHEGLICVEDANGYGYVDPENREVIPAKFLWADDFHEGRAEVQTTTGMGLIDRTGGFVIEPEYEIVDYKPAESVVHVRQNGRWALYDYLGHRLTEFGTNHEI